MSIPRIPVTDKLYDFYYRWAQVDLKDRNLNGQIEALNNILVKVKISPLAMYMLSRTAGRRMPEAFRWVMAEALWEILNGGLRTDHPEYQDLIAPTFGEMLGVLFTCAHFLESEVEIVRISENSKGKSPDFVLLRKEPSGHLTAHLLECKGTVEDLNNINQKKELCFCAHIRDLRNQGVIQLENPNLSAPFKVGYIISEPNKLTRSLPFTKNIAVTCIPDGRLISQIDSRLTASPPREECIRQGSMSCIDCIKIDQNTSAMLHVLHTDTISAFNAHNSEKSSNIDDPKTQALINFIKAYKENQRAIWVEDDSDFNETWETLAKLVFENDETIFRKWSSKLVWERLYEAYDSGIFLFAEVIERYINHANVLEKKRLELLLEKAESETYDWTSKRVIRDESELNTCIEMYSDMYWESGRMPANVRCVIYDQSDGCIIRFITHRNEENVDDLNTYISNHLKNIGDLKSEYAEFRMGEWIQKIKIGEYWTCSDYVTGWISKDGLGEIYLRKQIVRKEL